MNNHEELEKANKLKLERLKDTWYHSSPDKLYDLCIKAVVHNIDLILTKREPLPSVTITATTTTTTTINTKNAARNNSSSSSTNKRSLLTTQPAPVSRHSSQHHHHHQQQHQVESKYKLKDSIGPLPSIICESLIKEYGRYYLETLAKLERDEYFNNHEQLKTSSKNSSKPVTYFDLLMAFVCTPDKCSLSNVDYRQCIWASSTLETRLKQKLEAQLAQKQTIDSNYFKIVKTRITNNNAKQRFIFV